MSKHVFPSALHRVLAGTARGMVVTATLVLMATGCNQASVTQQVAGGAGGNGGDTSGSGDSSGSGGGGGCVLCSVPSSTSGGSTAQSGGGPKECGNGQKDPGEQCDDLNQVSEDGCSRICQIEAGWTCEEWGKPCVDQRVCGNSVLTSNEKCDDGNKDDGDGCSGDCQNIEDGWECRVPGRACNPVCGDGEKKGEEACDDKNTDNGDGCSNTCQIEPGYACPEVGKACVKSICGNGVKETGEACDCGSDATKLPKDCAGPNGLFHGDGRGCSTTCTLEPSCRDNKGVTQACVATCGNGNIEPGEDCDDGNMVSGDGCSMDCDVEDGFMCEDSTRDDTVDCKESINTGKCLVLPVKYRDFKSEKETGGHPDFFYYGAKVATPVTIAGVQGQPATFSFSKRYCVPNSGGPARKNDSTPRCWGMAKADLDTNGKPAYDTSRNGGGNNAFLCDCQFTDWSHDTNGGHVPGYTATTSPTDGMVYVGGGNGHPMYKGPAPIVTSAASFAQWWTDNEYTNKTHVVGTLELGPVEGADKLYRFSSAPHSVYGGFFPLDPPANDFPIYTLTGSQTGPGTVKTSTTGNNEPLLCNLWPYWFSSASFGAGANCKSDQYVFPPSFAPEVEPDVWMGQHINGDWIIGAQGWYHNSWFSVEARYLIAFNEPFSLQFFGDDDTFVFINGKLVIDLGGVHQRMPASVKVGDDGVANIQEGGNVYMACTDPTGQTNCPVIPTGYAVGDLVPCDNSADAVDPVTKVPFNSTCPTGVTDCDCRQRKLDLGLKKGSTYEIAIFQRDGHPSESNFQLTLSGFSTKSTSCKPACGNGVKSAGEMCDCGDETVPVPDVCKDIGHNNDDTYGGCKTDCTFGPFCGDGQVQEDAGEECDIGKDNGTNLGKDGCTFACKKPHYCGDKILDTDLREECDYGELNGQRTNASGEEPSDDPSDTIKCDDQCRIVIINR